MNAPSPSPEFQITRMFKAPRELVWKAWTDPALFIRWFGPKGFSCTVHKFDLRAGGIAHSCLRMQDGTEMWAKFVYQEVVPPSKLVWIHSFSDAQMNTTRHPASLDWPLELFTTVTLKAKGDQTELHLHWHPHNATTAEQQVFKDGIPGMNQGWGGTFEQLDAFLLAQQE